MSDQTGSSDAQVVDSKTTTEFKTGSSSGSNTSKQDQSETIPASTTPGKTAADAVNGGGSSNSEAEHELTAEELYNNVNNTAIEIIQAAQSKVEAAAKFIQEKIHGKPN